ncbi:MAG TPA: S1C family serine protease [Acidimicrobiales bacterium]|nr:S1C family serine protease [Acidimicrobiales bacterium]
MATTTAGRRDLHAARDRLLPRSVLGMVVLILSAAVGAAFSGTVLYAYYSYQLNKANQKIASYVSGFDQRFHTAEDTISAQTDNAKSQIQQTMAPLLKQQAVGSQMSDALNKAQPAVWFVHTLDNAGQPAVGSAFVVASDSNQSLLVTSFNTVQASTHNPAPAIFVRKGSDDLRATLWTWDTSNDLALLIVSRPNLPKLNFSSNDLHIGDRVFAVSGLGGSGGSISQGFVNDVSSGLIQDDAAVGPPGQGGPVIDTNGDVVGIASLSYRPLGFGSTGVYFTVPVGNACARVLRCPGGTVAGSGSQGGG